jgi:NAD(P)-dependent dehydrogenase (short-subunit alcohol dehydrogenase family)
MSAQLQDTAAWEASWPGILTKQILHRVPRIPLRTTLQGKTALVTGGSSGLGFECGRQLLQCRLSQLVITARSQTRGDAAAAKLRSEFPGAKVDVWLLDMASYNSVLEFVSRCRNELGLPNFHLAILNAGQGKETFERCGGEGGREVTLQVNYLATVLLAIHLIPLLKVRPQSPASPSPATDPARLTMVASGTVFWANTNERLDKGIFDAMDSAKDFAGMEQYKKTKLMLTMFVSKLAEIVSEKDVIVNIVNPSAVRGTALMREAGAFKRMAIYLYCLAVGRNVVDGTRQYLHTSLVLGPESHGSFGDWQIRP